MSENDESKATRKPDEPPVAIGSAPQSNGQNGATFFEQVWTLQEKLVLSMGFSVDNAPKSVASEIPLWCSKILQRLVKTVLKPILKLRPNGVMNWRNYGKMIGIGERYKTFITNDVDRIFKEEGFDKFTDQQWEKIIPLLGLEKLCKRLTIVLGRPIEDAESLEAALDEVLERQFARLDKLKGDAFRLVAGENAKTGALFLKGMAEGYTCFLNEDGRYVGDRGRTRLYEEFLVHRMEIEKYRRTNPGKSRRDLQIWILHKAKIRIPNDDEWFDHFCDEICLNMKGVGRKRIGPVL